MPKIDPYTDRELREVHLWSSAVLRRMVDLAAVSRRISGERRRPVLDESLMLLADAALAAIALYKALDATRRYLEAHPESSPPMPPEQLANLLDRARQARDAVVHLDEKMSRSPDTEFGLTAHEGISVTAPVGHRGMKAEVARIPWSEMEVAARSCLAWLDALRVGPEV